MQLRNRQDAGKVLAARLIRYENRDDVIVLALPRGGVPVAYEIASRLCVPLDVFVVRKLGMPGHAELAIGAIASGGVRVLNRDILQSLPVDPATLEEIARREQRELERREQLYRGDLPLRHVKDKTVIVVDDGIATGATMRAAIRALRSLDPKRIIVAVPVGPASLYDILDEADEVVCLLIPEPFYSVGGCYRHFEQTSDSEVRKLLTDARRFSHQRERDYA